MVSRIKGIKSCVTYKGGYSCGSRYIGEIKHNAEVRWNEHENQTKSFRTIDSPWKQHRSLFYINSHFKRSNNW